MNYLLAKRHARIAYNRTIPLALPELLPPHYWWMSSILVKNHGQIQILDCPEQ